MNKQIRQITGKPVIGARNTSLPENKKILK